MRSRTRMTLLTALAAVLATAVPVLAESSVTVDEASYDGAGKAAVKGTLTLDAVTGPQSVGGENADWQGSRPQAAPVTKEIAKNGGINLTDATIEPLADGSGLRFTWVLEDLPEQVPPEGVRYMWGVKIGNTAYQLQAKRTGLLSISTAEDPVNHVKQMQAGTYFSLRGACTPEYINATVTTVSGCYHLTFLKGAFDATANTVSIDWPFNTRDSIGRLVAPDFKPGAVLTENGDANMYIAAAFQAVVGNNDTADRTTGWTPYYVGPRVDLAAAAEDVQDPATLTYGSRATLTGTSYAGEVAGLTAAKPSVWARACDGVTCVFTSRRVVL